MASQAQKTYELLQKLSERQANQAELQLTMASEISNIKNGVTKINSYLFTDEQTNQIGLIEDYANTKEDVSELKNIKKLGAGIVVFFTAIGGFIGWFVRVFISK